MNVYYTGFKVVAAESREGMDKKRTFPLLYNVEEKYFARFEVVIDNELNIKKREMISKKGWIGYKSNGYTEKDEKDLLFVNSDGSWGCEPFKNFKNTIDFSENEIIFTGTVWLENLESDIESIFKEDLNKMMDEAKEFINGKIANYEMYAFILDKCPKF